MLEVLGEGLAVGRGLEHVKWDSSDMTTLMGEVLKEVGYQKQTGKQAA